MAMWPFATLLCTLVIIIIIIIIISLMFARTVLGERTDDRFPALTAQVSISTGTGAWRGLEV